MARYFYLGKLEKYFVKSANDYPCRLKLFMIFYLRNVAHKMLMPGILKCPEFVHWIMNVNSRACLEGNITAPVPWLILVQTWLVVII